MNMFNRLKAWRHDKKFNKIIKCFEGDVMVMDYRHMHTTFRILENDALIEVHDEHHVRKIDPRYGVPLTYPVIAKMEYVKVISGSIPKHRIIQMTLKEYLQEFHYYYVVLMPNF